jgi:subtilisin family serine protease
MNLKHKALKNKLSHLLLVSMLLTAMPVFSVSAAENDLLESGKQGTEKVFVVKTKSGERDFLFSDQTIQKVGAVFVGSTDPVFKNVFEITTTDSLQNFLAKHKEKIEYAEPSRTITVADLEIEKAEPNKMQTSAVYTTDPGLSTDDFNEDRQWGMLKGRFHEAWEQTKGSGETIVAVLDTGIDGTHEDLSAGQVLPGYNFISRTLLPFSANSDDNGHGTMVAGVIGATANNHKGIVGTNWNVRLMPLKALDKKGYGNSSDVAAAIVYATDKGADVINMSLGGFGFGNDTTLLNAIKYAYDKDVVLVAAAGNDVSATGGNLDNDPAFPICADNGQNMIIGVVATDIRDQKAVFSNYGKSCVDVSAPGKRILSTINVDPLSKVAVQNAYAYASGTSLAAPFVSGEAALLRAFYPNATNKEIRDRIIKGTDSIDDINSSQCNGTSCSGLIGKGRINAMVALRENLINAAVSEGDVVQADNASNWYLISGGKKLPISEFVKKQRFANVTPKVVPSYFLDNSYALGSFVTPYDGTLVKNGSSLTVYEISGGNKRPITYQIFMHRGYSFNNINLVSDQELSSWVTGTFLPPLEGTRVKTSSNPTQYWSVNGVLHPVNYGFYVDRGLSIFPLMIISENDLKGFAQGNAYIR